MKKFNFLFFCFILFSIFIYFLPINFLNNLNQPSLNLINLTNTSINKINLKLLINQTSQYVKNINQSSYLVFYPNLSRAYSYLNKTENQNASNNISKTITLLNTARLSAFNQEQKIYSYREFSFKFIIILTGFVAIIIYFLISQSNSKNKKTKH
ncbi:MAG: hypothetical protein M1168_03250 [Candidatus Marsarchaeota archaeon]|nr:hypothetical protein [Candidatus Marsarchaeota archaeon]MCL5094972.1 hypothetical protein [Candidatus Marsarchaeota archaeon]